MLVCKQYSLGDDFMSYLASHPDETGTILSRLSSDESTLGLKRSGLILRSHNQMHTRRMRYLASLKLNRNYEQMSQTVGLRAALIQFMYDNGQPLPGAPQSEIDS